MLYETNSVIAVCVCQGQTVSLAPVARMEEALYQYHPLQIDTYGPAVPELEQLGRLG